MSYETSYKLTTDPNSDEVWEAVAKDDIRYAVGHDGRGNGSWSWYEHEADMRAFSKRFPAVVFTLQGAGEDPGDQWQKHFKDGKMQVCRAVIAFGPFDAEKLA